MHRPRTGDQEPERFYHGFVLGLLADQRENYEIHSNRESGFGRYDVMMIPRQKQYDTELINRGIPEEQIYHLGFAFEGKNVLVGSDGIT